MKGEKGDRGAPGIVTTPDGLIVVTGPPGPPVCNTHTLCNLTFILVFDNPCQIFSLINLLTEQKLLWSIMS